MHFDLTKFLDALAQVTTAVAAIITTLVPIVLTAWPVVRAILGPRIQNAKVRNAFERLGEMGLVAANTAAASLRAELEKAKDPLSPGGKEVTPDELKRAYATALAVSRRWADDTGVLKQVSGVLGAEQIDDALQAMVAKKLYGNPVGKEFGVVEDIVPKAGADIVPKSG